MVQTKYEKSFMKCIIFEDEFIYLNYTFLLFLDTTFIENIRRLTVYLLYPRRVSATKL